MRLAGAARLLGGNVPGPERRRLYGNVPGPAYREAALELISAAFARSIPKEESLVRLMSQDLSLRAWLSVVGAYCSCYVIVAPVADLYSLIFAWQQGFPAEPGWAPQFALAWPLLLAFCIWVNEAKPEEDDARYWWSLAERSASHEIEVEPVESPISSMF